MASLEEALATVDNKTVRHIVPVSGGKDSAALGVYLKLHHPEIPAEYVFSDTDCELPETHEYLELLEGFLGTDIVKINALDYMNIERKPGRKAFDIYLQQIYGGFLPNPRSRWCTGVLKIKPFEAYVGESTVYSYIGIRADEDRQGYINKKPLTVSEKMNIIPVFPFKDKKLILADIKRILYESGLGLPTYYEWRSRSGCFFCFYQRIEEWIGLLHHHPDLFNKAKEYEKTTGNKKFTWIEGKSLEEVEKMNINK